MKRLSILLLTTASLFGQSWYNSAWQYRKIKAVDHRRVLATLANFPALIAFNNDTDLAGHLNPSCADFLVTLADGTKLDHEIVLCDPAKGTVHALARVPSLSSTVDTPLVIYYGNPAAADQSNKTGVWDSYTKIALPGGSLTDATRNHINAKVNGRAPVVDGAPFGNSYWFTGISSYLTSTSAPVSTAYTLDFWFKADTLSTGSQTRPPLVGTGNSSFGYYYNSNLGWDNSFYHNWAADGRTGCTSGGCAIVDYDDRKANANEWHHATSTWDGTNVRVYLDGILEGTSGSVTTLDSNDGHLYIAGDSSASFRGWIGPVTLSNTARSTAWVLAEEVSYRNPQYFMLTGAAEAYSASPANPVIHSFATNYTAVESGKPAILRWLVSGASSVSIDSGIGSQSSSVAGQVGVSPSATTTYTLTATNSHGSTTATVTVNILTGSVAYLRYGAPDGAWIRSFSTDGNSHAVIETWRPHNLVPGDYVHQDGTCTTNANPYASNLNGDFLVADVLDTGHFTIKNKDTGAYVSPNDPWVWCFMTLPVPIRQSGNRASPVGRAVPSALPTGPLSLFDGTNGPLTRHIATGTDNGLVSLVVAAGQSPRTATATFNYTVDSLVGDTIGIYNTTGSGDLNGEHALTAVGTNTITFRTTAAAGTYTHNDSCGPSAGNPNLIGGTSNCVVISFWAYSGNPYWANIVASTPWNTGQKHVYDGGNLTLFGSSLVEPVAQAAYRLFVDRKNQVMADTVNSFIAHFERVYGVGFWWIPKDAEGNGTDGTGNTAFSHGWMFNWYEQFMPFVVVDYLGLDTPADKSRFLDTVLNNQADPNPANQCTPQTPRLYTLASGTAQGGTDTTIILAASDTAPDSYYVNNIISFTDGSSRYYGTVTGYVSSTKTATVGDFHHAPGTNYLGMNLYNDSSWKAPTSSTAYDIIASATVNTTTHTITGYNTHFLTDLENGDAIQTWGPWYAIVAPAYDFYISARSSDTTATYISGGNDGLGDASAPHAIWIIPQWKQASHNCGLLAAMQWTQNVDTTNTSIWNEYWIPAVNDEGGGGATAYLSMGSALANSDARAIPVLETAWALQLDYKLGFLLGQRGMTNNGNNYGTGVEGIQAPLAMELMSHVSPALMAPTWIGSFAKNWQIAKQFLMLPDDAGGVHHQYVYGESSGGDPIVFGGFVPTAYLLDISTLFRQPNSEGKYLRSFNTAKSLSQPGLSPMIFPQYDPRPNRSLDYTTQPTQYLVTSNTSDCKAVRGGLAEITGCDFAKGDTVFSLASSAGNPWTDRSATEIMYQVRSAPTCCYDVPGGGLLSLYKVGHLLNNDGAPIGNAPFPNNADMTYFAQMPRFNSTNTLRANDITIKNFAWSRSYVSRWSHTGSTFALEYGDNSSRFFCATADLKGSYSTTYNRVDRTVCHLKSGSEEIAIQYDDIDASNVPPPSGIRFRLFYPQNGETGTSNNGDANPYNEGTTTCLSTANCDHAHTGQTISAGDTIVEHEDGHAADSNGPARTYGLLTKVFSPGTISLVWDGDTYANANTFTYGHAMAVSVCAGACGSAASTLQTVTVHKVTSYTDTTLTATALNPDSNWTGVQTAGKVALFSRGGLHNSVSGFTTTHAGTAQYIFNGLSAGIYTVTVGGNAVAGSPFTVVDGDNSLYFESAAGPVSITSATHRAAAGAGAGFSTAAARSAGMQR